ncbi:hypothetical protein BKA69DRAFT_1129484 [Paraphysoderma sedebokerense]|nr:hypothetical protein BKA69DRAFT_1129484 [Paraphysoderma sedebokerense]
MTSHECKLNEQILSTEEHEGTTFSSESIPVDDIKKKLKRRKYRQRKKLRKQTQVERENADKGNYTEFQNTSFHGTIRSEVTVKRGTRDTNLASSVKSLSSNRKYDICPRKQNPGGKENCRNVSAKTSVVIDLCSSSESESGSEATQKANQIFSSQALPKPNDCIASDVVILSSDSECEADAITSLTIATQSLTLQPSFSHIRHFFVYYTQYHRLSSIQDDLLSRFLRFHSPRKGKRNKTIPLAIIDGRIPIRWDEVDMLISGRWLNDEIINGFLRLQLKKRTLASSSESQTKIHLFNSFFYSKLTSNGKSYIYSNVQRWTRKFDLFNQELIIIPINFYNTHWALAYIDFRKDEITILDSMPNKVRGEKVVRTLKRYLLDEWHDKVNTRIKQANNQSTDQDRRYPTAKSLEKFKTILGKAPWQRDGSSCGVFTLSFGTGLIRETRIDQVTQDHIGEFRRRITFELIEETLKRSLINGEIDL